MHSKEGHQTVPQATTLGSEGQPEHRRSQELDGIHASWGKSGEYINIEWLYTEYPHEPNPGLVELLRQNSPPPIDAREAVARVMLDSALSAQLDPEDLTVMRPRPDQITVIEAVVGRFMAVSRCLGGQM